MRTACWIPKAIKKNTHTHTHTHTEYVILIVFPLQQWLRENASLLRYTYIVCLILDLNPQSTQRKSLFVAWYPVIFFGFHNQSNPILRMWHVKHILCYVPSALIVPSTDLLIKKRDISTTLLGLHGRFSPILTTLHANRMLAFYSYRYTLYIRYTFIFYKTNFLH